MPESVSQFGAAPMLMVRLAERERAQIFLESTSRQDLHRRVSLWVQALQQNRDGKSDGRWMWMCRKRKWNGKGRLKKWRQRFQTTFS